MAKHKALLALLVVGVLFVGATTAQAYYCEKWGQLLSSGYIDYDGTRYHADTVTGYSWCVENGSPSDDNSNDNLDYFPPEYAGGWARFVTSDDRDTLLLVAATYGSHENEGWKQTGQSGTKNGYGTWCGYDEDKDVYIWGSLTTGNSPSHYFDYNSSPPDVNGAWDVDGCSTNKKIDGGGDSGYAQRLSNVSNCNK